MDSPPATPASDSDSRPAALGQLCRLFLKLGTIAFGGPAAHVAMMEDEVVRRRNWLTRGEFLDLLGATNLIPGPNSTEMAIHIGYRRTGLPGLIVAGCCFIFPAVVIVTAIAWAYVRYGQLKISTSILYGVKPVIIAIMAQALLRLARTAVKTKPLALLGIACVVANALRVNELLVLFVAALITAMVNLCRRAGRIVTLPALAIPLPLAAGSTVSAAATAPAVAATLGPIFFTFLKIGSVLFGSGYVLLAFLRADFVERTGWLTEAQLLDATAVGQVTPGPLFTTATFIGYILAGPSGAILATVGIFLPAFIFVALSAPLLPRLRSSPVAGAMLDGLNVASLALMAVVTWDLGVAALVDPITLALAVGSAIALFWFKLNSTWLVAAGAVAGIIAR